jgi:serine/threonine protein kinase, bacterial
MVRNWLCIFALVLAGGCSSPSGAIPVDRMGTPEGQFSAAVSSAVARYLYVGNDYDVTVYAPASASPVRTIAQGPDLIAAIAFDHASNLYIAREGGGSPDIASSIEVYRPGATVPFRRIVRGINWPNALAFDHLGRLYVSNLGLNDPHTPDAISVFSPGGNVPIQSIRVASPGELAFDRADDLYVGSGDLPGHVAILVFHHGASQAFRKIVRGLTDGVGALLFDASGYLYTDSYNVLEYAPGGDVPIRTISRGIDAPNDIALDHAGNLYVTNGNAGSVTVYGPKDTSPIRTITQGMTYPWTLALDSADNLYVVNTQGCSCINVYAKGSTRLWYRITGPGPTWLSFGPI